MTRFEITFADILYPVIGTLLAVLLIYGSGLANAIAEPTAIEAERLRFESQEAGVKE